jgi:L-lactate dehydrogenase complex protein LldF
LFTEKLGVPREEVIEEQTKIARRVLRQKFLQADIGVSGANFLIADSGAVVLVENEGNARLSTSTPKIHVAVAGIEKLIPRAQDLGVFLNLLGRSATGQPLTVYTSFLSGPRRTGEIDGPDEFYLVLLDNGRTRLLADPEKRQSLFCIRCGACLNHCPVYRKIGGHNYPWVYSGPIGAIITPQFHGVTQDPWLPFASSLCGACGEVCPVKIEIPKLLLRLRTEVIEAKGKAGQGGMERSGFRAWAWLMSHPRIYLALGSIGSKFRSLIPSVGPLRSWASQREVPRLAAKSFHKLWAERKRAAGKIR